MHTIQPDQGVFLLHFMLPNMEREHQITRKVIEAIPANAADYRPDPNAKSALDLAWHIVSAEIRFLKGILAGEFDYSGGTLPEHVRTSADIGQWYGEQFEEAQRVLKQLSAEQVTRLIEFRGLIHLPAVFYLQFAISHTIHHRGQLSTYLRPMGGKVPSIYGESYDDRQARESQSAKA